MDSMKRNSMKLGFVGFFYPTPPNLTQAEKTKWQIRRATEIGCSVIHLDSLIAEPAEQTGVGEAAAASGVELELDATRAVFELTRSDRPDARARLGAVIAGAKRFKSKIIRCGYGELTIATSRFNREYTATEQLRTIAASLKEASKLMEDNDMILGIENHCDFTGRQLAGVLADVGSPRVGAALDTGNPYTVFADPVDDVTALAPFTVTSHMKDMLVVENKSRDLFGDGRVPFQAVGCAVGEGHVDIPWVIGELEAHCPHAEGLHLIVETGWIPIGPHEDRTALTRKAFDNSVSYLRELVGR